MLTPTKHKVIKFINSYTNKKGYSPTLEEIRKGLGLHSISTVHQHVQELEKSGRLKKKSKLHRSIEVPKNEEMIKIALLGTISAGQPIEATQERETIAVPKSRVANPNETYALRVQGDSMIEEGVEDGDTILVRKQNTAENGNKVVALLNGNEATLKTFYKEKGYIRLQPANKNYQPIIIKGKQDISVQGVLLDVIKAEIKENISKPFILPSKTDTRGCGKITDYLNRIYNGDVMHVLKDLPDNSVDMIFGDPDYNVGIKYGGNNYTRKFEDYVNWYIELTRESMRVLKPDGNLFMMNYPQQNAHLRVKYLDNYFPHINEYVWVYNTNVGHTPKRFTTAHRSILHVRKNMDNKFFKDEVALPYKNPTDRRILQNLASGSKGRMPYSWFEFNLVKNVSKEKTYHSCQIPQKLTEMLIKASTKQNDTVFVLFGGSGAEIDVCRNLKRQFISAEIDPKYCKIIGDRIRNGNINKEYKLGPRGSKRKDLV